MWKDWGTKKTWKPENPAKPWTARDYITATRRRRVALIAKRINLHGKFYQKDRRPPGERLHRGPCVPTEIEVGRDLPKGSLLRRIFSAHNKRTRLIAGKGHRIASFDRYGNRMWHPRYADVRICLVCKTTFERVSQGMRPGA